MKSIIDWAYCNKITGFLFITPLLRIMYMHSVQKFSRSGRKAHAHSLHKCIYSFTLPLLLFQMCRSHFRVLFAVVRWTGQRVLNIPLKSSLWKNKWIGNIPWQIHQSDDKNKCHLDYMSVWCWLTGKAKQSLKSDWL